MSRERGRPVAAAALFAASTVALATTFFGIVAAWPIYQTPRLWWVGASGAAIAFLLVWAGRRWGWGVLVVPALLTAFALAVVPLAVPHALTADPQLLLRGFGDGLAAVALGWKQLLTLTLPVGSYQAVLVPFLAVMVCAVAAVTALTLRGGRAAPLAAVPLISPVLFGTVFGPSEVSAPLELGQVTVPAPREIGLWLVAGTAGAIWVAWSAGSERRAALKRGRLVAHELGGEEAAAARAGERALRRSAAVRGAAGAVAVTLALGLGTALASFADGDDRTLPRDRVDPEIVAREQTSPLGGYRGWKRDAPFAAPVFTVSSEGQLPERLRLAVLDHYDGVDFTVDADARFTRFPSGDQLAQTSQVEVVIEPGYRDIWVPLAMPISAPPSFSGERAGDLADGFYVNRDSGGAIAVPTPRGLREGDRYSAPMSIAPHASVAQSPAHDEPQLDLESMPQLARWLTLQQLPASGDGLQTAIERLRERGYLSHSLTDGEGERDWLTALGTDYGTTFVSSSGGHSIARIEQLFEQLNEQEREAGEGADAEALVAGIGDDEQFATAAALIARVMGFDSRVAIGVRLGDGADAGVPGVPACQHTCTGQHIAAWVEVRGADEVWAPIDVSPQVAVPPTSLLEGEQLPEYPTVPEDRDASESDPPVGTSDQEDEEPEEQDEEVGFALWPVLRAIGLGLLALLLLALPFLFVPMAKRLRAHRRRTAAEPELRVLGAWDELLDRLTDAGDDVPRGRSRREVAAVLGSPETDAPVAVAAVVDRAVYAREGVGAEEAAELWRTVDAELAARRARQSTWSRLRAAYSLRSSGLVREKARRRTRRRRDRRRNR